MLNINCIDPLNRTALIAAIENENVDLIRLLLELGIEVKVSGRYVARVGSRQRDVSHENRRAYLRFPLIIARRRERAYVRYTCYARRCYIVIAFEIASDPRHRYKLCTPALYARSPVGPPRYARPVHA